MDVLNIPLTAIVSIVMGCAALVFTFIGANYKTEPSVLYSRSVDPFYSTQGAKLLTRHLQKTGSDSKSLISDFRKYYGDMAAQALLRSADEALPAAGLDSAADRLYTFRGLALMEMERPVEAEKSFQLAMQNNPANTEAKNMIGELRERRRLAAIAMAEAQNAEMAQAPVMAAAH
ncbi:MAG: hypothetical protein HZB29_00325 [Nitrospinae bacterium]|nr:hypothetical protein [Nitrospinota bacterium]